MDGLDAVAPLGAAGHSLGFGSVQDGIYALRKAHKLCAPPRPSIRSFPNAAFETGTLAKLTSAASDLPYTRKGNTNAIITSEADYLPYTSKVALGTLWAVQAQCSRQRQIISSTLARWR